MKTIEIDTTSYGDVEVSEISNEEIWLPVVGWEQWYKVSSYGKVITLDRSCHNHIGSWIKKGREKKISIDRYGYTLVQLKVGNKTLQTGGHRLVAQAFIPNPNNLPQVNHKDGNKLNNHVSNLEWCTNKENNDHAFRTGLKNGDWEIGEKNPMCKLTWEKVGEIRKLYKEGMGQRELAKMYNVDHGNISCIVLNKTWKI